MEEGKNPRKIPGFKYSNTTFRCRAIENVDSVFYCQDSVIPIQMMMLSCTEPC